MRAAFLIVIPSLAVVQLLIMMIPAMSQMMEDALENAFFQK